MHHIHLKECPSTQEYLINYIQGDNFQELLISCDLQTEGKGRQGKTWVQGKNSLAFSFTLTPNKVISMTSLEVGILIVKFLKNIYSQNIKLKWPNDLMTSSFNKCGGILCQTFNSNLLVGVGLNLGEIDFKVDDSNYGISSLPLIGNKKDLPSQIYSYILKNRLTPDEIKLQWETYCCHLNQRVLIEKENGIFLGIGDQGELLLKTNSEIKKIYSGNLFLNQEI